MAEYFSFPSKTFIVGEYAALEGAPAIIANTFPRFYFLVSKKKQKSDPHTNLQHFHPKSPAGLWLNRHPQILKQYQIAALDPHKGKGGFGFSSAAFNLVYYVSHVLANSEKYPVLKIWQAYRRLHFEGKHASGADVVSQYMGKLCVFSSQPFYAESMEWPFQDLDFILLRTGISVNTWEHLKELKISTSKMQALVTLSTESVLCLKAANSTRFIKLVNEYAACLKKLSLTHPKALNLLRQIHSKKILAIKACGALGAEVICVFFHPSNKQQILTLFKNTPIVADSSQLSEGLKQDKNLPKHIKF